MNRKIIKFVSYVLSFFLMLFIIAIVAIMIVKNTLLNSNYIMNVFESENYYENVSKEIESGFDNYFYQSGLEHYVIENLYDENKVKNDTHEIIDSIYSDKEVNIETDSIKNNLRKNIDKMLEEQSKVIEESEQETVNTFIDIIADTYESEVTIYKSGIKPLADLVVKLNKIINIASKIISVSLALSIVMIVILNIKRLIRVTRYYGISLLSSGMTFILFNIGIKKAINIDNLYTLSKPVSDVIKHIINDVLNSINNISMIFILCGIILIVINAFFGRHHHHHHVEYDKN